MKIPRPVVKGIFFATVFASALLAGRVWPTQSTEAANPLAPSFVPAGSPTDRTPEVYQGNFHETSIAQILSDNNVTVDPADKLYAFPNPALGIGSQVEVFRASVVVITDGSNQPVTVHTWSKTVADLATEQNFQLGDQDTIVPPLTTAIPAMGVLPIDITRVSQTDLTVNKTISYATKSSNSADLQKGQTQVTTAGVNGVEADVYLVKRVNGVETSRSLVSTTVVKAPVTQVTIVGIGPKLTSSGPYQDTINAAAKKYLIDGTILHCMMMAESGGGANAGNPGGTYNGLFQYTTGFWASASAAAGYAGASIYDPTAQIYTTAYELMHNQTGRWSTWGECKNL